MTPWASRLRLEPYDYGPTMRIADLMQEGGRQRAEAILRRGDIWAGLLQQLGQIPQQVQQMKLAEEERGARAEERRAMADYRRGQESRAEYEQAGRKTLGQALTLDDPDKVKEMLVQSGRADLIPTAMETLAKHSEMKNKLQAELVQAQNTQAELLATGARYLKNHLTDSDGGLGAATLYAQSLPPHLQETAKQYLQAAQEDPSRLGPILEDLIAQSPTEQKRRADLAAKIAEPRVLNEGDVLVADGKTIAQGAAKPDTRSLEIQAAAAFKTGDMATYNAIKRVKRELAQADDKPKGKEWVQRGNEILYLDPGEIKAGDKPYAKAPQTQRLTKDERQDFASWNYALPKIESFAAYVEANPDKWGKFDASVEGLKQLVPGLADEDYASQTAFIGRLNSEIRHALFGASLTAGEKESANDFLILKEDQPRRIIAKLREAAARARANMSYYRELGFNIPEVEMPAPGKKKSLGKDPTAGVPLS